ncbi:MAG: response regulator [Gemmatimonadota bacterium]|nr:response regulator [Gemmatimonadota bacterium]
MPDGSLPEPDRADAGTYQRVLLVEDEPSDAVVLEHALESVGIPSRVLLRVESLGAALALLSTEPADLAIVDLGLPDSSGAATVRTLRKQAPDMPLIVISAGTESAAAIASLHEGADDYLVKGAYDTRALDQAIRHARERRRLWSEARRRTADVERAERQLRTVVEANTDGMLILDATGIVRFANESARTLIAPEAGSLAGTRLGTPVLAAGEETVELDGPLRDGTRTKLEMRASPIEWEATPAHLVVLRDVTEHRLLEERVRQSQKMEALGKLTGGISHDFNNVLAVILNGTDALREMVPAEFVDAHHELREIDLSARRAAGMVRRLLGFSRRGYLRFESLDLGKFTDDALALMRRMLTDKIRFDATVAEETGTIRADPAALQQIFLNVVANARDAMPDGGTFSVEVCPVTLGETHRARHPWVRPGRYERVSLTDTGGGMQEETRSRIFEPFFTTKGPETGTGLGMAMVYGLMKQHRGLVHVYSEPGEGTRVELFFPSAADVGHPADTKGALNVQRSRPEAGGRGETILVIEDEPALRRGMKRVLSSAGYGVLLAGDGRDGLETYRRNRNEVALVISDLVMPKLGGREVLAGLRDEGASCPFVLVTGYGAESVEELRSEGIRTITKPWSRETLLQAIHEALGPPEAMADSR